MATVMLRDRYDGCTVAGAGTHALPGHPMSVRTRTALARHGLADPAHRSAEFDDSDARRAALVIAMAPEHVRWVRRVYPRVSARTVTLKRVIAAGEWRRDFAAVELEDWEEVVDPAGGEQADFDACADEISELIDKLIPLLDGR